VVLEDKAADEVVGAITQKWEPQERKRLLAEQLKTIRPHDLVPLLADVWNAEDVQTLIDELSHYRKFHPSEAMNVS